MSIGFGWRESVKPSNEMCHIHSAYEIATKGRDGKKHAFEVLEWLDFTTQEREKIADLFAKGEDPLDIFTVQDTTLEGSGIFFEGREVIALCKKAGVARFLPGENRWDYGGSVKSVDEYWGQIRDGLARRKRLEEEEKRASLQKRDLGPVATSPYENFAYSSGSEEG